MNKFLFILFILFVVGYVVQASHFVEQVFVKHPGLTVESKEYRLNWDNLRDYWVSVPDHLMEIPNIIRNIPKSLQEKFSQ